MGKRRFHRDLQPLVDAAEADGWTVSITAKSHIKFMPPAGSPWPIYISSGTPGEYRGTNNARAFLRRCEVKGI